MWNPLKKIIETGKTILEGGSAPESAVGVDIGSSSIKVVELKRHEGRATLLTYGTLALGPYNKEPVGAVTNLPNDVLGTAIVDALKESGVATREGAVAIPALSSLVFLIELPSIVHEKDLGAIVPTEARKYIPVPISEVMLDYWAIPHRERPIEDDATTTAEVTAHQADKTEVLAAAIHHDTIARFKDIAAKGGVHAAFYEIELFSTMRALLGHELSVVLIVDIGALKTKLTIVDYGVVRSFHIVNRGSHDITTSLEKSLGITFAAAEELKRTNGLTGSNKQATEIAQLSVDFIATEIRTMIQSYEHKYNRPISKVLLTGGGSLMLGVPEHLKQALSAEVILSDPFGKVETPAFLEHILSSIGAEYSVAIGLALRQLLG